jgi:hypothetical protein
VSNTYTDSKYAFTTIHVHEALSKERGLINSGGKIIQYGQEILKLLDAVGHKTGGSCITAKGSFKNSG